MYKLKKKLNCDNDSNRGELSHQVEESVVAPRGPITEKYQ